jgi:hypothetical protein
MYLAEVYFGLGLKAWALVGGATHGVAAVPGRGSGLAVESIGVSPPSRAQTSARKPDWRVAFSEARNHNSGSRRGGEPQRSAHWGGRRLGNREDDWAGIMSVPTGNSLAAPRVTSRSHGLSPFIRGRLTFLARAVLTLAWLPMNTIEGITIRAGAVFAITLALFGSSVPEVQAQTPAKAPAASAAPAKPAPTAASAKSAPAAAAAPAGGTPAGGTPAGGTPAGGTPAAGIPAAGATPAKPATGAPGQPKSAAVQPGAGAQSAPATKPAAPQPTATQPAKPAGGQTPAAAPTGANAGGVDAATYVVRLRDLESRVEELKEQVRRSHTRLSLLSESVLAAGVGGARAEIVFRNSMSNAFRVTGVLVVLDGAVQYNEKGDDAAHLQQKVTPIFDGAVPPGDHTLQIVVSLQGHGYGVFSYLRGYKFEARSTHSFTVRQGKALRVEAIAWEKGTATTPLDQKPAVRFVEQGLSRADGSDPGVEEVTDGASPSGE